MTKDEKTELLSFSANALGGKFDEDKSSITFDGVGFNQWNPVDNDGDALRLAVMLELDVQQDPDSVLVWFWIDGVLDSDNVVVEAGYDRFAATRLAITQAAAEIGKSK